ncbi:CAP domain-containing protein [Heyndrickxia oleronia]|uniref:CAP domain-containing protein n=1 Tax=Heyndrickxia oleronia TaxID=38875 RepID=A0AAW6SZQ4_9BACI|nr:CAP domain-containing protein [Heyndrickxia oleronia]MDH5162494.1 CAP domain-containing protein [Heyndrickxia oleronia]
MFRLLLYLGIIFLLIFSLPSLKKELATSDFHKTVESIESNLKNLKENINIEERIKPVSDTVKQIISDIGFDIKEKQKTEQKEMDKVNLTTPSNQMFSINNVELGDAKKDIDGKLGSAKRVSQNEYGEDWYAYHKEYHQFFMVMYDQQNKVNGLYTNQNLISSTNGIKIGRSKESVRNKLGKPLTSIQKGWIIYKFQKQSDYDVFLINDVYITIFYDKYENNTVTALQLISKDLEDKKKDYYTIANQSLEKGFEYQLFDLTNSARVNHQLPILTWDQHVKGTALDHSRDMAKNNYFDHTNLKGQSPFDRMSQDHISFILAGENIAYGQMSSIFAHEGLMNSMGHRKNILQKDYEYMGVGVAFNDESQPYYTQNFYAK